MASTAARKKRGRRRLWQILAAVAVIAVVGYFFVQPASEASLAEYRMGSVQTGTVISTVAATGTVNAVGTVEVTSQVSGQIIEVLVDYNSQVTEGQVLARVNPESFEVKLIQAEADLAISNASLVSNRASVERARSDLRNAEASLQGTMAQVANSQISLDSAQRDWERQVELFERKVISNVALEQARSQFEQAQASFDQINSSLMGQTATLDGRRASLEIAQSGVVTATAQVLQREASLTAAQIELANTAVRSPVDGVIIERAVEKGQTAASSTNSNATLFTIAENLRNMQVEVSVDEADIGTIREGMRTTFTVDSYPGREFNGVVAQVRFAPKTVQNVVTYIVVVSAPNPDLALLPGLTASVRMVISERQDVLRIPNAALRFEPFGFEAPEQAGRGGGGAPAGGFGGGGGFGGDAAAAGGGGAPAGGGGGRGGGGGGGGLAAAVPEGVDLTEDQQAEVTELMGDVRQVFGALR
ncbi:MAG: HlyD family secretion protein, partial [Alphaproteobacteria bacterium]|nr:HlyD family secretion protein [Alphaproteobacteria bacterium]